MAQLRFLGSGDAFGNGGRNQTCMHLSGGSTEVLIDCGATTLVACKANAIEPNEIDAVLLSHLHGDHIAGLPFMILDGQFRRRTKDLVVAGPPGTGSRPIGAMEVLFPGSSTVERRFEVNIVELRPGSTNEIAGMGVSVVQVDHSSGAPPLWLRVSYGGVTLAYSGDTAWTDELLDAARGADLLVCEAYTWDRPVRYPLDFATLEAHRRLLDCGRIVLTHMRARNCAGRIRLRHGRHVQRPVRQATTFISSPPCSTTRVSSVVVRSSTPRVNRCRWTVGWLSQDVASTPGEEHGSPRGVPRRNVPLLHR